MIVITLRHPIALEGSRSERLFLPPGAVRSEGYWAPRNLLASRDVEANTKVVQMQQRLNNVLQDESTIKFFH